MSDMCFKLKKYLLIHTFEKNVGSYNLRNLHNTIGNINLQLDRSKFIKGRFEDINLDGSIVININGLKQNLYSARIIDDRN